MPQLFKLLGVSVFAAAIAIGLAACSPQVKASLGTFPTPQTGIEVKQQMVDVAVPSAPQGAV